MTRNRNEPITCIDRTFFDLVVAKMMRDNLTPDEAIKVVARFRCLDEDFLLNKVKSEHLARYDALHGIRQKQARPTSERSIRSQ